MPTPIRGEKAPDFEAPDQNGRTRRLGEFRGRNVVLFFYLKDGTPGCTKEACGFRDHVTELRKTNTVVLGVSADTVESHKKFVGNHNLTFDLLSDPQQRLINAYGVAKGPGAARTTFVIDAKGKIARVYPEVDPGDHAVEVLGDLQAPLHAR